MKIKVTETDPKNIDSLLVKKNLTVSLYKN